MIPAHWTSFVATNALLGRSFRFGPTEDKSGVGADLVILTVEQCLDEATNCWPGIAVAPDGYVPVASCSTGSGDWYYINSKDGPNGPLYRIYHDAVTDRGYEAEEAIVVVLSTYGDLLQYAEP